MTAVGLAFAIAGFDLLTDSAVGVGFLGDAPLLAAARGASPRQVIYIAALVTLLVVLLGVPDDIFGELVHVVLILSVMFVGVLAVYVAHIRLQRDEGSAGIKFCGVSMQAAPAWEELGHGASHWLVAAARDRVQRNGIMVAL